MAYISTERISEIRKELKTKFPGLKMSITRRHYSTICIAIMEAPVMLTTKGNENINHYHLQEFEGEKKEILTAILNIANADVTHSETGDYGRQPSFYVDLRIGQWDKPFKMVIQGDKGKPVAGIRVKQVH